MKMRLGLRRAAYGEPDAGAFRRLAPDARALRQMPEGAATSEYGDHRRRNSKVKRGRPQGPRMKCGWGCGEQLTASRTIDITCLASDPTDGHQIYRVRAAAPK
jgi:hypothetical protein